MRKTLLLLISFAGTIAAKAQTDSSIATVTYTLRHLMDTTQPDNPYIGKRILLLGSASTVFMNDPGAVGATTMFVNGSPVPNQQVESSSSFNTMMRAAGSMYRDMATGALNVISPADGKLFAVEESTPIDWTITQESKEIVGITCQKATGHFKGRDYEAWFSTQLPYNSGPWKLNGLPGLILEASDTKKEVMFTLSSFQKVTDVKTPIAIPPTATKVSKKEFAEFQDAVARNRQAMIGSSVGSTGVTVRGTLVVGASLTSADGKPFRRMNNPIEKEEKKKQD